MHFCAQPIIKSNSEKEFQCYLYSFFLWGVEEYEINRNKCVINIQIRYCLCVCLDELRRFSLSSSACGAIIIWNN